MKIESITNSKVKVWYKLKKKKYRDLYQLYIIEEKHLIEEALKNGVVESLIYIDENEFDFEESYQVNEEIMRKLSFNTSLNNYLAICKKNELYPKSFDRILILDNIQDPGNLGTIIRSARSFNFDCIYLSNNSVDLYNNKTIQATQGAFMDFPIIRSDISKIIHKLKEENIYVVATYLESSIDMEDLKAKEKMAFVMGNEGRGISKDILKLCDVNIKIRMSDFESLNVAIASSIIMYKFNKVA